MDVAVLADHIVKIKDKYLDFAWELKKNMEYESDGDTNCCWCTWDNPQKIGKGTGRLGNKRTRRDHPNYSIVKIGQNTEKSLGVLRRLEETSCL